MRANYLSKFSPATIRISSGISLIIASNFQSNETKVSILWTMSLSLGISGFLYGTLGEHLARKYMSLFLRPKLSIFLALLAISAVYLDSSQIVSQSILLSILALLYQVSRIRDSSSFIVVIYFTSIIRVVLPLITEENFLSLLSSIYILTLLLYSVATFKNQKNYLATLNQQKSSLSGALTLSFNWFLIQQSFTFFVLHKSNLEITAAANLIILTRIFELSTFPSVYQAFNAPNYLEDIRLSELKSRILKSELLQIVISFGVVVLFVSISKSSMFERYHLPIAWVFIVGTCYIMAPDALHCVPSLLRLSPPRKIYIGLIVASVFCQIMMCYFVIIGNITAALTVLSFNYNYVYMRIKNATFEVFPHD